MIAYHITYRLIGYDISRVCSISEWFPLFRFIITLRCTSSFVEHKKNDYKNGDDEEWSENQSQYFVKSTIVRQGSETGFFRRDILNICS